MIPRICVLIAVLIISAPLSANAEAVDVNEPPQATDTADCSQKDFVAACDAADRASDGTFIGRRVNLDGWIWARAEKRRKRFAAVQQQNLNGIRNT